MSETYDPHDPDQRLLLPAAWYEWRSEDRLACFISGVVDQLDLPDITARYEGERRGGPPYHPRMMVKVSRYGYYAGVVSSPRIAQRLREDFAFRVLAANNRPAPYQVRGDVTSAPYRTFAQNRPRRKVTSIPGRQPIKSSATSPPPSPASCRAGRSGLPAVLSLPGGGGP